MDELERARREGSRLGGVRTSAGRDALLRQADVLLRLARSANPDGPTDAQRAYIEEAIDLVDRVAAVDPLHPEMPALLLDSHQQLGAAAVASGDSARAASESLRAASFCIGANVEQRPFIVAAPELERQLRRLWLEAESTVSARAFLRAIGSVSRGLDRFELRMRRASSTAPALDAGSDALPSHPFHRAFEAYVEQVTATPVRSSVSHVQSSRSLGSLEALYRAGRREAAALAASAMLERWAATADATLAAGQLGEAARAMAIAVAGHRFGDAVLYGGALIDALDRAVHAGESVSALTRSQLRYAFAHARSEALIDMGTLEMLERAAIDLSEALEELSDGDELPHHAVAVLSYLAFYRGSIREDRRGGAEALELLLDIAHPLMAEQPHDPRTLVTATEAALTAARLTLAAPDIPLDTRRALFESVIGALELRIAADAGDVDAVLEYLEFSALFIYGFGLEPAMADRLTALRQRRDELEDLIIDLEPEAAWKRAQIAELRIASAEELSDAGRVSTAIAVATEGVDIARAVLEQASDSAPPHERLAKFLQGLAGLYAKVHDHPSETRALIEAVDVSARRLALPSHDGSAFGDLASVQERASIALKMAGEDEQGAQMLFAARETLREWHRVAPEETGAMVDLLRVLRELQDLAGTEPEGAAESILERLEVLARLEEVDPHDPRCAVIAFWIHYDDVFHRMRQGDSEAAAAAASSALTCYRAALRQGGRNAEEAIGREAAMVAILFGHLGGHGDSEPVRDRGAGAPTAADAGPQNRAARRAASRSGRAPATARRTQGSGRPLEVRAPEGHRLSMPVPWAAPVAPDSVGKRTRLKPSNTGHPRMFFGVGLAGSDDLVAVGAPGDPSAEYLVHVDGDGEDTSRRNRGAVHLYRRSGGVWTHEAYLKPGQPGDSLNFGWSVAVEGDLVAIGAPGAYFVPEGEPEPLIGERVRGTGAVWLFERSEQGWIDDVTMLPPLSSDAGDYGHVVALSGGLLAVGDPTAGEVHLYERDVHHDGQWMLRTTLSDPESTRSGTRFGSSLAIDGDTLVVGATDLDFRSPETNESNAGAAWVFGRRAMDRWEAEALLLGPAPWGASGHGLSVDVRGDVVAVGAPKRNQSRSAMLAGLPADQLGSADLTLQHGAVCVYRRRGSGWEGLATVEAPEPHGQFFGSAVRILPDGRIVVGAGLDAHGLDWSRTPRPVGHPPKLGAVYVIGADGVSGKWRAEEILVSDPPGGGDEFGSRVALLHDGTLLVASPNESSSGRGVDPGVVDQDAFESGCVRIIRI